MMIFAGADLIKSALNHALGQREWTAGPPDDVRFSLFFHCFSLFFHCFFIEFYCLSDCRHGAEKVLPEGSALRDRDCGSGD